MPGRKKTERERPAEAAAADKDGVSLVSIGTLIALYEAMVQCRMLAERARALDSQSTRTGGHGVTLGQEASLVGVMLGLKPGDTIVPSTCDLITKFLKGVPLEEIFRENEAHTARKSASRVAAQLEATTRAGLANKAKKNGEIVVAFRGGKSAPPDVWSEALKFAGAQSLPILFVCISQLQQSDRERPIVQSMHSVLAKTSSACRIPGIIVDGSDVVAVYRVAHEAIVRARAGRGPTLIECVSYAVESGAKRIASGTRDRSASKRRAANDPIRNMEEYLRGKGLFTPALRRRIAEEFNGTLDRARKEVAGRARLG